MGAFDETEYVEKSLEEGEGKGAGRTKGVVTVGGPVELLRCGRPVLEGGCPLATLSSPVSLGLGPTLTECTSGDGG